MSAKSIEDNSITKNVNWIGNCTCEDFYVLVYSMNRWIYKCLLYYKYEIVMSVYDNGLDGSSIGNCVNSV